MGLFFGAVGEAVKEYRDALRDSGVDPDLEAGRALLANTQDLPLKYPALMTRGTRTLALHGLFTLRDGFMDGLLDGAETLLGAMLDLPVEEVPRRFANGAFNGLLLDGDRAWLFNDFSALLPLYYSVRGGTLLFSTNLRLLARILNPGWDEVAIREFLQFGYNWSYRTPLQGIRCLPPASLLEFSGGKISSRCYSTFPTDPEEDAPLERVTDEVLESLGTSMRRMFSPRLKYSLSLTGGMDSRIVFLEWPDRQSLLTQTSGEGTSDYLKARELTEKLGNPGLHVLEDLKSDRYLDGFTAFYDRVDNPTKLMLDYNYHHLEWQRLRGADIHMTGTGGETLNGENLYLSRSPSYVMREALMSYTYHPLREEHKGSLLRGMNYAGYKSVLLGLVADGGGTSEGIEPEVTATLGPYFGSPSFQETFCERFRTLFLANFTYYPLHVGPLTNTFHLYPYMDVDFNAALCRYHPKTRELRRLELSILRRHPEAFSIPLDTSHLRVPAPYAAHRFGRAMRMVFNIGLHKKIPLLQKGDPPKLRAAKYFDPAQGEFRDHVKSVIFACPFFDGPKVRAYFAEVDKVTSFNFYTHHNQSANIKVLFRLAAAAKGLGT